MKYYIRIAVIIFLSSTCLFFSACRSGNKKVSEPEIRQGTAIVITGAAARIPQETALLEELDKRGLLEDVVFISGASAGSINSAVLNGILAGKYSWKEYKEVLFKLQNKDIYIFNGKELPVDTSPLSHFLKEIINSRLGYKEIRDLPVATSLSVSRSKVIVHHNRTYRFSNKMINKESDPDLDLVEILMASGAFPVAFPKQRISNLKTVPDEYFIDGGIAEDRIPFEAVIQFEKFRNKGVKKMFIISRKSVKVPDLSDELKNLGINDSGFFNQLGISLDEISDKGFNRALRNLAESDSILASRTYVYIPDFKENFLLFDFTRMEEEYKVTNNWARNHEPVLLRNYLKNNSK